MIKDTQKFMQGKWGKCVLFFLAFSVLYAGYGCTAYQQVPMDKQDFMANRQIQASLSNYHFYLHQGTATYRMENVEIVDGRDISGTLEATKWEDAKTDWKRQERKEWWSNHKYDIHIYTHHAIMVSTDEGQVDQGLGVAASDARVVISDPMIQEIKVMSIDAKAAASDAVVVLVVLVGVALIVLLAVIIADSDNGGNGGGGSDSGSGSDSGESSD
jgi:hypothetical protein